MGRPRALNKLGPKAIADAMRTAVSLSAAADALGVNKGTISRWVKSGKVPAPGQVEAKKEANKQAEAAETAEAWGKWVRGAFGLTRSEVELVELAEIALAIAKNAEASPNERMNATKTFQALLNHLKLDPGTKDKEREEDQPPQRALPQRRAGIDPRAILTAVR